MTKVVNNFAGLNGFVWWVGVIINRADELALGRCQVRIFGWTDALPDADLQWAHPMVPVNNSKTYQSPEIGDWVVGFFMDSEGGQFPVMMGVLPGFINSPYFQEQAPT